MSLHLLCLDRLYHVYLLLVYTKIQQPLAKNTNIVMLQYKVGHHQKMTITPMIATVEF